jgi:hypothetical protein
MADIGICWRTLLLRSGEQVIFCWSKHVLAKSYRQGHSVGKTKVGL